MGENIKMTRKEAISILEDYDINFVGYTAEEITEAFDKAIEALKEKPEFLMKADGSIEQITYYQDKYNHTMKQINKLAQMMHDNALMYQNLLDHNAQGKINPYADIERWMNMIFDEDFL